MEVDFVKYSVGIDIGYATLKCVVLNKIDERLYDSYIFHHGDALKTLKEELLLISNRFGILDCYIGIAGRHGKAQKYSVNDISALIEGTLCIKPEAKSIIEIGAQSSRYIAEFSKDSISSIKIFENSSCSAGTGSFLEEQVSRLGIKLDDYSKYTEKATKIPRIAGRCSVFSKTDMIHHQQDGVSIEDILLGLSYALVRNYKANVVQRNEISNPVLFAGGVALNKGVCKSLIDVFKFKEEELIIPKEAAVISALGAAIIAKKSMKMGRLESVADEIEETENVKERQGIRLEPLASYGLNDAKNKHVNVAIEGAFEGSIGIDIGSTSTNIVLIDDKRNVISHRYLRTSGNPRKAVNTGMESILKEYEGRLKITSIGTTGSGRILIGKEMKADTIINEITAQAKGSTYFIPDVDTIFEIGGQDSKYIQLENGSVVNFEMNKICAAGTGSFIEEQAKKLEIEIEDYEGVALRGRNPLNLGNRCTVFIEGNISKALTQGESKEDITAGLSYSIVNNYLNRVVVNKPIGNKILLQGGIAYNQSVVNAFRAVLKKDIIVPPYFSVLGAVGVALLAQEENIAKPVKTCAIAENGDIQEKAKQLFKAGYIKEIDNSKLTIGIPRVLFMHKLFPLFNAFFQELGFNVILSEATNEQVIKQSQMYSMDETCYPIKLINGHVANLITKGIDYLFLPSVHTMKHETSKSRENYACVYIQTAPKIVADLMDLEGKGIKLLSPALSLKFGKKYMMTTMLNIGKQLGKGKIKTALALKKGMQSFKRYEKGMLELGKTALDSGDETVFVVITRAYGAADKGLNMKIPEKLKRMGYKVLTLSNLDAHKSDISKDYPNMYWPFGQHILAGAKIVKSTKNLYAIYLTYHGCGPDTILNHYFKEEMRGKQYMHIEVDEHDSNVGVMTRLEAFVDSIKHKKLEEGFSESFDENLNESEEAVIDKQKDLAKSITTYIPYLFPYSHLIREMLNRRGIKADILPKTSSDSLAVGKKISTSKEYLSLLALLGDVISKVAKLDGEACKIWVAQSEGSETFGQYSHLLKQKLKNAGYKNVEVISPFIEDMLESSEYGMEFALILVAGDIIMMANEKNRSIVLEKVLKRIGEGNIDAPFLITLAKNLCQELLTDNHKKKLYVLGEASVVFNPILNDYTLEGLEKENRLLYMPLSEMMYFDWYDYFKKEKKGRRVLKNRLRELRKVMLEVSKEMGAYSSFDENIDELINEADSKLPLYSGGSGRYRMAKQFRCSHTLDALFNVSSMYEDTGIVIKILKKKYEKEYKYPVLDLYFDGSRHASNEERVENFMYYV